MVSLSLVSSALMGLLVLITFVAIARIGAQRVPPQSEEPVDRYTAVTRQLSAFIRTPVVWTVGFVILAVGIGAASVLAVGDFGLPEGMPATLLGLVYGLVGLLLTGFVFTGAYFATRGRGLGNAHGIAAGSFAAGLVFLLLVTVQLLFGVIG